MVGADRRAAPLVPRRRGDGYGEFRGDGTILPPSETEWAGPAVQPYLEMVGADRRAAPRVPRRRGDGCGEFRGGSTILPTSGTEWAGPAVQPYREWGKSGRRAAVLAIPFLPRPV